MKILYLLDESWDSGLTASALNIAGLLNKSGLEARVLCREKSYAEAESRKLGLEHFICPRYWFFSLGSIREWLQKQDFQILHSHTGSMQTLGFFLKRDFPQLRLIRTRADAGTLKRRWFYPRVLALTDRVLFPSKKLREEFLITYDYPMNKTRVIYPTIEEDGIPPYPPTPLPSYPIKVTLLGRLDPIKGQEDFIKAASLLVRKMPEISFEIIGAEKNTKIVHLEKLAKRLGVSSRLHIHGFLEVGARDALMKETTVAVVASRGSEVVSRVLLEWMRLGKPIIATRVGVIPELLGEPQAAGLLVEPHAPEELAYALGRVLKDEKLRNELGGKAQETFRKRFEASVILKEHLALYQEVIAC